MPSPLGRPIRVGVFEHDPDAFNCFRLLPHRNCSKPGAEIEIIRIVMELLDWEWEIVDTAAEFDVINDFGTQTPEGDFSGIMGLLARNAIDMSGLSMRITPERMRVAHFTFPIRYFQETYGIMLKQRVIDPTATSAMVLEAVLIAAMVVVSQYYQSSMNSKLTAPSTSAIPFYHQDELLTLLEQKKRYLTYYVNLELEGSNERNMERIKKIMKYNPVITHENEHDLIAEINFNKALTEVLPGIPQVTLNAGYAKKKAAEDSTIQDVTHRDEEVISQKELSYQKTDFTCFNTT
ncbi:hypothetical protein RB195_021475 [Necator americanus]|uniref:Receptor ligand binding region domain-containing protein n=1 Tax=Necator americanus TaxID=51031 RepID=A0ABR1EB64_NECAM